MYIRTCVYSINYITFVIKRTGFPLGEYFSGKKKIPYSSAAGLG